MSLFDHSPDDASSRSNDELFPTEPAFLVPVQVLDTPQYGEGHNGVFAKAPIKANTKFWMWTDRIISIPYQQLQDYMDGHFGTDNESAIRTFLRQGFVLPGDDKDTVFYSNPTDARRFMNHSNTPNCGPDGTLRDVAEGEELTMDYSFHGNPLWYQDICQKYGVHTEAEVARGER